LGVDGVLDARDLFGERSSAPEVNMINSERRCTRRYEMRLPVRYRVSLKDSVPLSGTGSTCDLSTTGISFRCRRPLPVGAHIELLVDWPARHGENEPVELQITGFVTRNEGGRVGVRSTSRKFRVDTAGEQRLLATA
jgi:hypothetical protein